VNVRFAIKDQTAAVAAAAKKTLHMLDERRRRMRVALTLCTPGPAP
jgi:hypothetical protein